jgi:hypothetical protein
MKKSKEAAKKGERATKSTLAGVNLVVPRRRA